MEKARSNVNPNPAFSSAVSPIKRPPPTKKSISSVSTKSYLNNTKKRFALSIKNLYSHLISIFSKYQIKTSKLHVSHRLKKEEKESISFSKPQMKVSILSILHKSAEAEKSILDARYQTNSSQFPTFIIAANDIIYSQATKKTVWYLDGLHNQPLEAGLPSAEAAAHNLQPLRNAKTGLAATVSTSPAYINTITNQIVARKDLNDPTTEVILTLFDNPMHKHNSYLSKAYPARR
ncbi:MAG: hypothetical protein HAW62_05140 [Endozoicomonadaceae bacterium]|nr:hypothetical protein [Endozoicomonadaceae bacterium]